MSSPARHERCLAKYKVCLHKLQRLLKQLSLSPSLSLLTKTRLTIFSPLNSESGFEIWISALCSSAFCYFGISLLRRWRKGKKHRRKTPLAYHFPLLIGKRKYCRITLCQAFREALTSLTFTTIFKKVWSSFYWWGNTLRAGPQYELGSEGKSGSYAFLSYTV